MCLGQSMRGPAIADLHVTMLIAWQLFSPTFCKAFTDPEKICKSGKPEVL